MEFSEEQIFNSMFVCDQQKWNFYTSRLAFELGLNSASASFDFAGRGRERKIAIGGGTRDELWILNWKYNF